MTTLNAIILEIWRTLCWCCSPIKLCPLSVLNWCFKFSVTIYHCKLVTYIHLFLDLHLFLKVSTSLIFIKIFYKSCCKILCHANMYIFFSLEPLSAGDLSVLNAPSSTEHSTGHNILPDQSLLKSSNASDIIQCTPSKDDKRPTISQLTGSRYNISVLLYVLFSFF